MCAKQLAAEKAFQWVFKKAENIDLDFYIIKIEEIEQIYNVVHQSS